MVMGVEAQKCILTLKGTLLSSHLYFGASQTHFRNQRVVSPQMCLYRCLEEEWSLILTL